MRVYHVIVDQEDDWYVASALEDQSVFTQGRTLDEIIANIREVALLLHNEKDVQVELVVPPQVTARPAPRRAGSNSSRATKRRRRTIRP